MVLLSYSHHAVGFIDVEAGQHLLWKPVGDIRRPLAKVWGRRKFSVKVFLDTPSRYGFSPSLNSSQHSYDVGSISGSSGDLRKYTSASLTVWQNPMFKVQVMIFFLMQNSHNSPTAKKQLACNPHIESSDA